MISVVSENSESISKGIASRLKERRLELNLTQEALALRSGLSLSTYRNFERTGVISLKSLIDIAIALRLEKEFANLFSQRQYTNIDEVIREASSAKRMRGKIKK